MRAVIKAACTNDFTLKRIIKLEIDRLLSCEKINAKCYIGKDEMVVLFFDVVNIKKALGDISSLFSRCVFEIRNRYLINKPDILKGGFTFKLIA
jgi:hypothetical protein